MLNRSTQSGLWVVDVEKGPNHLMQLLFSSFFGTMLIKCTVMAVCDVQEKLQIKKKAYATKLREWHSQNRLSINASKCDIMLVSSKQWYPSDVLNISISNKELNYGQCASSLGLNIDYNHAC